MCTIADADICIHTNQTHCAFPKCVFVAAQSNSEVTAIGVPCSTRPTNSSDVRLTKPITESTTVQKAEKLKP